MSRERINLDDTAEELDTELRSLYAFRDLCMGCIEDEHVKVQDLTYLLDPILERQRALVDRLYELGRSAGKRNT